ncbi:MAG: high frequency lysogenization protein HflD [Chromatiales bacterium]|nr:high frequency lysogenization protein HflD [Chromatiales bacterium]
MNTERDRCIAFAGLFQSTALVSNVAHTGMVDTNAFEASIYSLFQLDADSVTDVYGGLAGVAQGLKIIRDEIGGKSKHNVETSRYAISLLHLERQLKKYPQMLDNIGTGIQQANARLEHFSMLHTNILAQLAEIYANNISTLKPRIMVQGEPVHLQNPDNVHRIRALLLAGIRSAILWRQCGGNRFQILLGRKKLADQAGRLLDEIQA